MQSLEASNHDPNVQAHPTDRRRFAGAMVWAALASRPALADPAPRWFADRPVAWQEHDDGHVPVAPAPNHLQAARAALTLRDSVVNEADRILSLEGKTAARDVNAAGRGAVLDLVLRAQPPAPDDRGGDRRRPGDRRSPRLPLTIVKSKDVGAASGYQVKDADGASTCSSSTPPATRAWPTPAR